MRFLYGLLLRPGKLVLASFTLALFLGAVAAKAVPPPGASPPIQLLILGDSLTAGYGLPVEDGFQAKLAIALKQAGENVTLVDGAVSGDTTADAAARLDWVLAGGPVNAAMVELGGNDGLRGLDPGAMERNLTHILDVLAADHIPVLLCGIFAPPSFGMDYEQHFTAVFNKLSRRPGVTFYPFFLNGVYGNRGLIQADGIHPNAAGVDVEVKRLTPLVLRLLAEAKPGP
jgi:acyl-CoA thioesterase-1